MMLRASIHPSNPSPFMEWKGLILLLPPTPLVVSVSHEGGGGRDEGGGRGG